MGASIKILKNNRGQSIFEFIAFLPFLVIMYSIVYTVGNSINGSINQQKATRGYFYNLNKNNSFINTYSDLKLFESNSMSLVGFSYIGWRVKSESGGTISFAPCFSFNAMMKSGSDEGCDDKPNDPDISRHIRVYTAYGVCGPTYRFNGSQYINSILDSGNAFNCATAK